eukprot:31009-Pelagococcus_subviridis.AAC.5
MNSSSSRMCPLSIAASNGVRPLLSLVDTAAPLRINNFATSSLSPRPTHACKHVTPSSSLAELMSAPC